MGTVVGAATMASCLGMAGGAVVGGWILDCFGVMGGRTSVPWDRVGVVAIAFTFPPLPGCGSSAVKRRSTSAGPILWGLAMCWSSGSRLLDAILQDQHLAGVRRAQSRRGQLSADGERSGPRRQCSRLAHCSFPTVASVLGFNYEEFTAVAGPAGWDRVVGFSKTLWAGWRPSIYARYLKPIPRLAELADVGNTDDSTFSLERLISLRPDLVILPEWAFTVLQDQVRQMETLGIPVMVIDYNAEIPERHVASTLALGLATNNEDRARDLARLYVEKLADIARRIGNPPVRPKAYIELG